MRSISNDTEPELKVSAHTHYSKTLQALFNLTESETQEFQHGAVPLRANDCTRVS